MRALYVRINKKYIRVISLSEAGTLLKISRQAVLKRVNRGWYRAIQMDHHKSKNHQNYLIPVSELKRK